MKSAYTYKIYGFVEINRHGYSFDSYFKIQIVKSKSQTYSNNSIKTWYSSDI